MDDPYRDAWDASYQRRENTLFYPAEEVVRFVNRYIRRRTGVASYSREFDAKPVFMDVGSGAGRHLVFLWENGFFPVGVELSATACAQAREFLLWRGAAEDEFRIMNGSSAMLSIEEETVDHAMCVSTLDSMPTQTATETVASIRKALKPGALCFADMIAPDQYRSGKLDEDKDQIVAEELEKGTVQSYYNRDKIDRVFKGFEVVRLEKIAKYTSEGSLLDARWFGVFRKTA